jgi:Zn-dependent peptidase ImmA (M78 family)
MTIINPLVSALARTRELAATFCNSQGSVDVFAVARALGVVSVEARPMSADGYLGRQADGNLVIRYRAQNGGRRNRFTVAHEIAHMLLAEAQGKDLRNAPAYSRDHSEELTVNRIASELLMPQHMILRELRLREVRGDPPGWRAVCALRHRFEVSDSAMALRMLEIQGLHAILFRVNIEGNGPKFPCDRSEGTRFTLAHSEDFDADRLWREARRSNRHVVPIKIGQTELDLRCEGLLRSITTRRGLMRQYWVLGWRLVDRLPEAMLV